mmetsp:Transcript_126644/g.244180  ORF Transcript_126644/g.244180 Transcript_126644/m.244180 type:complete len:532 (+) Transcript_126644:59-1654(+)
MARPASSNKPRTKAVALSQKRVPVYYEHDEEARAIATNLFTVLDEDGSGYLCQGELQQAQSKMLVWSDKSPVTDEMLDGMTGSVDKDGDNRIDDEEWHQFFRSLYELLGRKQFMSLANRWVSNMGTQGMAPEDIKRANAQIREANLRHAKTSEAVIQGAEERRKPLPDSPLARTTTEGFNRKAADPESSADAADHAAALKIQKSFRGKKGRKQHALKKSATAPAGKTKSMDNSSKAQRVEQKSTTFGELWDHLMIDGCHVKTRLAVDDIIELFIQCKKTGLNQELANMVPMQTTFDDECSTAEDVSVGEVAHLSMLLITRKDLSFEEAQAELLLVKDACREISDAESQRGALADRDAELGMRAFKTLLEFLSRMMRIDLDYFISHIMWLKAKHFEMTDTLAALIMERAARKETKAGQPPDLDCLEEFFSMNYVMNLAYHGNIIDATGASGIVGSDLQLFYQRVHRQMPHLLQGHAEKRKRKAPTGKSRDEHSLLGRTEIEILMGELFKEGPLSRRFASPLSMTVFLLQGDH